MKETPTPALSVVLLIHRDSEMLRSVLNSLRDQSVASCIECVIVAPAGLDLTGAGQILSSLFGVHTVEVEGLKSAGVGKAAGVRAARSPLVAFLEDHTFPDRFWAESLMAGHRSGSFAVVGPVVHNANPTSSASWGCFLVYYGSYSWARAENEIDHLPANHSCYRRDLLLEYGPRLEAMLEAEAVLHQDLLAKGHRLYQEPSSRAYHLNYSRLAPTLREYFLASRGFAARRASGWSRARRTVYAVGSPLLPLIRPPRVFGYGRRSGLEARVVWKAMAPVLLAFCAGAAGEMLGYGLGVGRAEESLLEFEQERDKEFSPRDLEEARGLSVQAADDHLRKEP